MAKILLVGATGYIGGTVLDHLIRSEEPSIKPLTIDVLIRDTKAAGVLREAYGDRVRPIPWAGFTDIPFVTDTAANYDIIVNAGTGFAADGAEALVRGLERRRTAAAGVAPAAEPALPVPWMIHLSGCSNLADRPVTGTPFPERTWDDEADAGAIFDFLAREDARDPYPQRTAEVGVLAAAEESGVAAVSLNSPCVFGTGTGLFNRQGFIIPLFTRYVLRHGHGFKLNETANFDWVHVADLAGVFVMLVRAVLERGDHGVGYIPTGTRGIISTAVGRVLQAEMMQQCLDAAFGAGILPKEGAPRDKEIRQVGLEELAGEVMGGLVGMAERSWAGHKVMTGTVAKKLLGWNPTRLEEAWRQDYHDVLGALQDGISGNSLETSIGK